MCAPEHISPQGNVCLISLEFTIFLLHVAISYFGYTSLLYSLATVYPMLLHKLLFKKSNFTIITALSISNFFTCNVLFDNLFLQHEFLRNKRLVVMITILLIYMHVLQ